MTITHLSSLALPRGVTLPNRIVVPPMASGTGDAWGRPGKETLARYARLAASGAGLVFVEYTYVHRSGRSEPNQLGLDDDGLVESYAPLAAAIREAGAVPGIQLTHAGGKTSRDLTEGPLMAPSGIPVPVKGREMETPDAMDHEDISLWESAFAAAARRAFEAGFSVVELHMAHGYGFDQWLSPLTNRRPESLERGLQGRMALPLAVVRTIREQNPGGVLAARIGARDFLEGGKGPEEGARAAELLVASGCDIIDVSSGIGGWRRPGERRGEGYLVPEAAFIQARTSAPVIGVGGIETTAFVDACLRQGLFSLAAVGRAILEGRWSMGRLKP